MSDAAEPRMLWTQQLNSPPAFDLGQADNMAPLPNDAIAITGISTNAAFTALALEVGGNRVFERLAMPAGQVLTGLYIPLPTTRGLRVPRWIGASAAAFDVTFTLAYRPRP